MKRVFLSILASCCLSCAALVAQDKVPAYKRNYVDKKDNFVERTRQKMESTVDDIFSSSQTKEDGTVKISGEYYMHIYRANLYKGAEGEALRQECRSLFAARFPTYTIVSVALPQTAWVEEAVVKGKTTVGYIRFMCCYILAYDGDSGYINARYVYKDYKDVGQAYVRLTECNPRFDRADLLSKAVYEKLLEK